MSSLDTKGWYVGKIPITLTQQIGRGLVWLLLLAWLMAAPRAAAAPPSQAAALQVSDTKVEYAFGDWVRFQATLDLDPAVNSVSLAFQERGLASNTYVVELSPSASGAVEVLHDIQMRSIQVFAEVDYWFLAVLPDGSVLKSDVFTFLYEDNRFDWSEYEEGAFRVHWYGRDVAFGQLVLDKAQQGLAKFQEIFPLEPQKVIDIYAYASHADYQVAREFLGPVWAGGHADPALGLVMVSLPSGPSLTLTVERKIPHEIAHLLLYQAAGTGYSNLPIWLLEGLASYSELYPNPDYSQLLAAAYDEARLLPMGSLCEAFPRETGSALLSYAQSESFIRYIADTQGVAGIRTLVDSYASGESCTQGTEAATGKTLSPLERSWRADVFGERYFEIIAQAALPWVVLALAVIGIPLLVLLLGRRDTKASREAPEAWISKQ